MYRSNQPEFTLWYIPNPPHPSISAPERQVERRNKVGRDIGRPTPLDSGVTLVYVLNCRIRLLESCGVYNFHLELQLISLCNALEKLIRTSQV